MLEETKVKGRAHLAFHLERLHSIERIDLSRQQHDRGRLLAASAIAARRQKAEQEWQTKMERCTSLGADIAKCGERSSARSRVPSGERSSAFVRTSSACDGEASCAPWLAEASTIRPKPNGCASAATSRVPDDGGSFTNSGGTFISGAHAMSGHAVGGGSLFGGAGAGAGRSGGDAVDPKATAEGHGIGDLQSSLGAFAAEFEERRAGKPGGVLEQAGQASPPVPTGRRVSRRVSTLLMGRARRQSNLRLDAVGV